MLSSIGFHTVTFYKKLTLQEAKSLYHSFRGHEEMNIIPYKRKVIEYNGEDAFIKKLYDDFNDSLPQHYDVIYRRPMGIKWSLRVSFKSPEFKNTNEKEYKPCSIKATINPKIFTGITDYVTVASEKYLNDVEVNFNHEAERISPVLGKFDSFLLNRVDYCFNFDIKELGVECSPEQMMSLIKRSYIPAHFNEWEEYNEKSHRMMPNKNSLYLTNRSVTVNCYPKHYQLKKEFPKCPNVDDALNVIRFEIQCKYPKVYNMTRNIRNNSAYLKSEIMEMMSDDVSCDIIHKYFNKVIRRGDYYQLEMAKRMVTSKKFHPKKTKRLIDKLDLINSKRGISKAKEGLEGKQLDDFNRSIRELEEIRINPVTIPREWGIKYIRNLLDSYYDKISEEQWKSRSEQFEREMMEEYFNKKQKKKKSVNPSISFTPTTPPTRTAHTTAQSVIYRPPADWKETF